jgi:AbrB family looped-hinge helix DNA binding protein
MVRSKARLTSKGQLTLPAAVRARLGVVVGDTVTFEMTNGEIRVARDREPGTFEKWEGRFRSGRGYTAKQIDERIGELRGRND